MATVINAGVGKISEEFNTEEVRQKYKDRALEHLKKVIPDEKLYNAVLNSYKEAYPEEEVYSAILGLRPFDWKKYSRNLPKGIGLFAAYPYEADLIANTYPSKDTSPVGPDRYAAGVHFDTQPSNIFVSKGRDKNYTDRTVLHELEHDLTTRLDRNKNQGVLFKEAGGDVDRINRLLNTDSIREYLERKFKYIPQPYFDENLTELGAAEAHLGEDLTRDWFLRKNLFKNHKDRIAFRATTGLRKTRLDSKDLQPLEPIPEADTSMWDKIKEFFTPDDYGSWAYIENDLYTNPLMKDPFE